MTTKETPAEKALRERCEDLEARIKELEDATGLFASDRDLDGTKGNPNVKFDPRDWRGDSHKGRRLSECDPEFLAMYAGALAYMADNPKPNKEQYAKYDRLDASRCRSWRRRILSGDYVPPPASGQFPGDPPAAAPAYQPPAYKPPSFDIPASYGASKPSADSFDDFGPGPAADDSDIPF